ncbi:MAG: CBS domain-containing protein [Pyrobaculum sp.]|uniref:CBS domain-containing protein n=1 Tax=Pyrobaculum sp. TaxID=2004705 RepID=UPI0031741C34
MSKVREYIKGPPITVGPDASAEEVARIMAEKNVGSVVVVDAAGRPIAIVTERDLVRAIAARRLNAKAIELGTRGNLLTAYPEDDVYEVLKKMRERRVRHLIVVDKDGLLRGVISIRDLLEDQALKALGEKVWWPPPED